MQIDLFYDEITYFQPVNRSFWLVTLNGDQSIDLPHRSGPTKRRDGTGAITGIQCGAEEAVESWRVLSAQPLALWASDTKSAFLLNFSLSKF